MKYFVLLFLLLTSPVFAEEKCSEVDASGWSQLEKVMFEANAYSVMYKAGHNIVPKITREADTLTACFENGPSNTTTIITKTTVEAEHAIQEAAREAASQANEALKAEAETLDGEIETSEKNWSSLTQAQKIEAVKKVMRRQVLRKKVES